mmetsp:Transcript_175920/g.427943  ORF Transcript_175920/g.427943 Transcript_175920/m.427943 type:complete len:112 (-) Transcript_175920:488-823(-)
MGSATCVAPGLLASAVTGAVSATLAGVPTVAVEDVAGVDADPVIEATVPGVIVPGRGGFLCVMESAATEDCAPTWGTVVGCVAGTGCLAMLSSAGAKVVLEVAAVGVVTLP